MVATGVPFAAAGGHPVDVRVTDVRDMDRRWGIPIVGVAVRAILALPHFVVLRVLEIGLAIWFLLGWIWILAYGRVPALAVRLVTEYLQRSQRVAAYVGLLMPGAYPPLEPGPSAPAELTLQPERLEMNRLWGIPAVNWAFRFLALVPQIIVLTFLAIAVLLTLLVLWIPILADGRYPEWAASFYGRTMRYVARIAAWAMFMPVRYPPIFP
jgi:hypothetical protein